MPISFNSVARLPSPEDNVAIASQQIDAGTEIHDGVKIYRFGATVLEGHRFAYRPIRPGEPLLSWGLPFGYANRCIEPGQYVCNDKILRSLAERRLPFPLPEEGNFDNHDRPFELDETTFTPGRQVDPCGQSFTFSGYDRGPQRGVGTRNHLVIMGTSSLAGSYARALASRLQPIVEGRSGIDGVAVVAHTEGGEGEPNNLAFTLRALAGFMVHPNVGAILAVDFGDEAVNNVMLQAFLDRNDYPIGGGVGPRHAFLSLGRRASMEDGLAQGMRVVEPWIDRLAECRRTPQPASALKLALQCGGSDAFSGVSGNPLAGWLARQVVACGGSANLAETDELIGAESYVLSNVRDLATAKQFLEKIARFKERAAWHGHSAEGNTTGGNHFRGLYNITIKSIGAARKKDPAVRLDAVIDYAQRMQGPGYYFMDSPGNDLESVAGQVASGANLILFTTGNGSITNFPFAPTIKIITTSRRHQLIPNEMDVNAGRYQDGMSMDDLGAETFTQLLAVASGHRSAGERAGHSQVQLWRDWRQTDHGQRDAILARPEASGRPWPLHIDAAPAAGSFFAYKNPRGFAADCVAAVVPTSLCSGQVAQMMVDKLNRRSDPVAGVSRFVTFVHTEGCGVSSGYSESIHLRTLAGHMTHPMVRAGLFLEHGCEKTHNDAIRQYLGRGDADPGDFGWASIQLDGGIEAAMQKVTDWFETVLRGDSMQRVDVGLEHLRVGLLADGDAPAEVTKGLADLAASLVVAGARVVVPMNTGFLQGPSSSAFRHRLGLASDAVPNLGFGTAPVEPGLYLMETPTRDVSETITGLGATGVDVMLAHVGVRPLQCHPMIPLVQIASGGAWDDMDLIVDADTAEPTVLHDTVLNLLLRVVSGEVTPQLAGRGYSHFQVTRGLLGVSL